MYVCVMYVLPYNMHMLSIPYVCMYVCNECHVYK
jgi:hypothetical protein